jgi:ATP-binding cassette, subfamily B, multidrug efflux pump
MDLLAPKQNPILFYIKTHRRPFFTGLFFLLITNIFDSATPLILKRGIDQIVAGDPLETLSVTAIFYFVLTACIAVCRFCWRIFFARYHTFAAEDLRNRIFKHLTAMGPQFFKKNPIGELMSLITNDVQSFRTGMGSGVLVLVDGVSLIFIVLPMMLWMQPDWTWKVLILLPTVPFLIWKVTGLIFRYYKIQQDKLSELSGISAEIVAGIRVIKSFAQESSKLNFYNSSSRRYEDACNRVARVDSLFGPVMQFGVASGTVILLFVGGNDVFTGAASIGTLVAFQRFISKMVWPMTALGMGLSQVQKGMASFSRIRNVLEQVTDIPDNGQTEIKDFESLKVKNLNFQFPENSSPSLKNISFEIHRGEKIGLVGPVGSGKTTLLHLLNRLYPAPSGTIFINDIELDRITQRSLHLQMALVPQEPFLFSDSVADNMTMGLEESAPDEEVVFWAQAVDIHSEIEDLPQKFQSQLGERGVNLSGGQKQRLTIARGLMTRAPMIQLDDSLSAVDHKTEKTIQKQLEENLQGKKTQIIVSHRLSAVEDADQIIVLNSGEIEAIGTHQDLLKTSKTYRNLAEIQGYEVGS